MRTGIKIISCLFIFSAVFGCRPQPSQSPATARYTIAFYNLENLFDTVDDPDKDDQDFLPNGEMGWDDEKYETKLQNIASVIDSLGDDDGPELLGVCELENRKVLENLISTEGLRGRHYEIVHYESADKRGIDVALLYKPSVFVPQEHHSYPVTLPDTTEKTRDILVVNGLLAQEPVTVVVAHFPSRRGGEASEAKRMAAATLTRKLVDQALAQNNKRRVIIMGDFNDEPQNKSIQEGLQASGNPAKPQELFNAFYALDVQQKGSYKYRDEWNMLDQIILSQNWLNGGKLQYVNESATIYQPAGIQEQEGRFKGSPLRTYAGTRYLGGFSDHFPIYIHITAPALQKK